MIAIGNINASKVYLGDAEVGKIYLGGTQVWGGSSPTPPSPYDAQVEYLENINGAYINIGKAPTQVSYAKVVCSNCSGKNIFGSRKTASSQMFFLGSSPSLQCWVAGFDNQRKEYGTSDNNEHTFILDGRNYYIDGTLVHTFTARTFTSTYNVFIFGLNNGGSPSVNDGIRIHEVYLTIQGVSFDLIPVRVGQVGYMYDKVSETLLSAATGSFIIGNDVTT